MGNFLTVDRHHLRLSRLVNLLVSGLFHGLFGLFGLSLVNLGSLSFFCLVLSLLNLGFLSLGFLFLCFLFHSICLVLVLVLFLVYCRHIGYGDPIARANEFWQVDVESVMRKLRYQLPVLLELRLLCWDAQRVRQFLCIFIQ